MMSGEPQPGQPEPPAQPVDQKNGSLGRESHQPSPTFIQRGKRDRQVFESAIGDDDRIQVPDPQNLPWRMVCELTITGGTGGQVTGTGWLAGPRTIITAGHNVFDPANLLGFAVSIVATPGRNGGTKPFGFATSTRLKAAQRWLDATDPEFDIGAITLDRAIGNDLGFFAAAARPADQLSSRLANISGYPESPGGGILQFHSRNRISAVRPRRLFYDVDTSEGQSGAPVWIVDTDAGPPIVVGVHTYGNDKTPPLLRPANSATLITSTVLDQIRQWVEEDGA